MSKFILAVKALIKRRFLTDQRGIAAIEFGLILPLLLILSFGILEFTFLAFDYHRATEATRRGARLASMNDSIADLSALTAASPVTCTSSGGIVSCTGGAVQTAATFDTLVTSMRAILPAIQPDNVQIVYGFSGIGDATTPGGILPLVSVSIVGLSHNFLLLDSVMSTPVSITYPPFTTTHLAKGYSP